MYFYRISRPTKFKKTPLLAPRFIVVAQGKKLATFKGGELSYDEDHFLVVTAETTFQGCVFDATPKRPYLAMCLELPPDVVARTLLAIADAEVEGEGEAPVSTVPKGESALPAFVSPLTEPVMSTVTRLIAATDDAYECKVVAPLVMEELVFRLLRTDAASIVRGAVQEGDRAIQTAMNFIRTEMSARSLSVEKIARHVGMSPSHFAHRFTAVARVSPMRFLKSVRLEAARELMLVTSGLRVSEAASRVGYESASHFTRDFKVAYGASPAEYVKQTFARQH
jgi:AraC-like DNA-binding protein